MKKALLTFMLAVVATPLVDLFIYDASDCTLEDHIVANSIEVHKKESMIRLRSKDEYSWTVDDILIQDTKEYHIKENGKETVLRKVWGHVYNYEGDKILCKQ